MHHKDDWIVLLIFSATLYGIACLHLTFAQILGIAILIVAALVTYFRARAYSGGLYAWWNAEGIGIWIAAGMLGFCLLVL